MPEFSEKVEPADVDPEGATKLLVTAQALLLRRQRPELFAGYRPVPAEGPAAEHAIAFARSAQLVAVATRLPVGLAARGGWADTVLPLPDGAAAWTDVLTGTPVEAAPHGSRRCWRATRSRCWSGPGDRRRPQALLRRSPPDLAGTVECCRDVAEHLDDHPSGVGVQPAGGR